MKRRILIVGSLIAIVLLSFAVFGVLGSVTFITPSLYTTLVSTTMNLTVNFNQTSNSETQWNATIYNSSEGSTGPFSLLEVNFNVTNGTQESRLLTLVDGSRHWVYVNITNVTGGPVISSTRILDVDLEFLIFKMGTADSINFTLGSEANISVSGWLHARNISLVDSGGVRWYCGVNVTSGNMYCRTG